MMKKLVAMMMVVGLTAQAATVFLESTGSSTGDNLEGVVDAFTTVDVAEIAGLQITAKTAASGHKLNSNSGDFGINSAISGEMADAFDFDEEMIFTFDKSVRFTRFDFNRFHNGDQFNVAIGTSTHTISYDNLDDKSTDYIGSLAWDVSAGTEVSFAPADAGDGQIGLDTMDVSVIPEPTALSLLALAGAALLRLRR